MRVGDALAVSMDFHALPRRDLQALCKRNGVRANMTNAAMADALRALPTVDGIEEYVNQPVPLPTPTVKAVAEEEQREKQGSQPPRGRHVTVKSPEKTQALSVVAPTTRRRAAAASKSEARDVASETVPALNTRRKIQSTVPMEAEEKVPRARRKSRASARKTMQLEEEEEKPQCVVSDVEVVPALPVSDEGCDDPEEVEEATNPQNEEGSGQEDEGEAHAFISDVQSTVPSPVSNEVRDDAEDVEEATKPEDEEQDDVVEESSQEDEGVIVDTPTAVAEEYTGKSALQEPQVNVHQCAAPLLSQEDSPILDLVQQERGANPSEGQLDEDTVDHHATEEKEMVPVNELPQTTLKASETTEEVGFTGDAGHANEENEVAAVFSEAITKDGFLFEDKEDATVDEVLHDTFACHETILLDFSDMIGRAADEMPQSSATMNDFDTETCRADEQKEVVTVDNVSQVTVTDNENVFSSDMPPEFNSAGDLGDRISITSPFLADILDNVTKSKFNNVIAGEPTVSEAEDVSQCMRNNSNEKSTGLVAVEEENEVKDEKQSKEPPVLTKLSLRKLRAKLKEKSTGLVAVEEENKVTDEKQNKEPLVLTKLSLRKLRAKLKEKSTGLVAVEEENEVKDEKQNKEPLVLTKLSLRNLRAKLKETLIAQCSQAQREGGRCQVGRERALIRNKWQEQIVNLQ